MGLIALLLLAAIAAGGGGKSTSTTKKKPVLGAPPKEDPKPVVSNTPVTPEDAPKIKNSLPTSFVELGVEPGTVLKLNSVDPTATDWPGVRSLPDAWQRGALKLLSTIHYDVAMGKFPLSTPTLVKPESLYSFAAELEDAYKSGSVGGFGTNAPLALRELLTTARRVESARGYNAANRWGWEGSY